MKYAVIQTGGKQYKVVKDQTISVEKLEGKPKSKITFDKILLYVDGDKVIVGQPNLKSVKVEGVIIDQLKDKKIKIAKFRAKSRYRLTKGHRQQITKVKITSIKTTTKKT